VRRRGPRRGSTGARFPPDAIEARWVCTRRLCHPKARLARPDAPPRGSLLFMPGRGDAYEKYLETFEHWRRQAGK
jgi:lysophospholipase